MNSPTIAVLGYGLRVPGAHDPDSFWDVVSQGRDTVTRAQTNVGATSISRVHAYGVLDGIDQFDHHHFNYSPREAADMDPQQRQLLHCAVEALEAGGVRRRVNDYDIGVWASTGLSGYLLETRDPARIGLDATSQLMGSDPHYAATRIAFALGLTGPAVSIGSACSSSLLAIHAAAQAIIAGECDLALAGGMDIDFPQPMSYIYEPGGILSPDGVCRPFDAAAGGTVFGSGGGLVLLADHEIALNEGWPILAALIGSAVNNDGANKAFFTAPRPARQADVIAQALSAADLEPASVGFIECHGTGTQLGDRAELEALASVFGNHSRIVLGSTKANFGHLRVGAGVVGFVKACESLVRRQFPPLANLNEPIPTVAEHGFVVTTDPVEVDVLSRPVVGISSFGFGGTNVHVLLRSPDEPAKHSPALSAPEQAENPIVLTVSTGEPDSCVASGIALADYVESRPGLDLGAMGHTLAVGREPGRYRLAAVATDLDSAARGLHADPEVSVEGWAHDDSQTVVLFAGQGSGVLSLGRALWKWEEVFTERLSDWANVAGIGSSALARAMSTGGDLSTGQQHTLLVAVQLAVAAQLQERGLKVSHAAGYSLGEYAAAVLAGSLDVHEVIKMLLQRGAILDAAPRGRMFMVAAGPERIQRVAPAAFTAARVSDQRTLISCAADSAGDVREALTRAALAYRDVDVDVAYHSPLLGEAAAKFAAACIIPRAHEEIKWISTLRSSESSRPYWARHLDSTIDFRMVGQTLEPLAAAGPPLVVDFSDDGFLGRSVTRNSRLSDAVHIRLGTDHSATRLAYMRAVAQLWSAGVGLDVSTPGQSRSILRLPRRRWASTSHLKPITKESDSPAVRKGTRTIRREASLDDWIYQPSWVLRLRSPNVAPYAGQRWLVFTLDNEWCDGVIALLEKAGIDCACLSPGEVTLGDDHDIKEAVARLHISERPFDRVVHLWCSDGLDDPGDLEPRLSLLHQESERGFYALLFAFQELTRLQAARPLHLDIVALGIHPLDSSLSIPERSLLLGPSLVLPQDYPFVTGRTIDITGLPQSGSHDELVSELLTERIDHAVVLQGRQRWVRTFETDSLPVLLEADLPLRLRERGVYLITGGLGGIGMTLAEFLVRTCRARLVLTGLEAVPDAAATDDAVIRGRRAQIAALESLGGEVMAVRCDAANFDETKQLMQAIDDQFGALHGVIHAAGVFETQQAFRSIDETGREDCARRLLPKVQGTLVLAECLKDRILDFVITQSSLSSQLGGLGFYAYTAGNAYMDAFTERHRNSCLPWMTVNWDGWIFRERGDDTPRQSVVSPSFASPDFGVVAEIAVRPSEGAEIYGRLMNTSRPRQVLISTADFNARIKQWVNASHDIRADTSSEGEEQLADPVARRVAEAWREVLGLTDLTPDANFFAVGGDSLLGVSLAHRLSVEFGTVLSAITLFENATLKEMVDVIKQAGAGSAQEVTS